MTSSWAQPANLENFQILTRGISEQRRLSSLTKPGCQSRTIAEGESYHMACADNRWYIIGFDVGRKGMRTFALTRMSNVELLQNTFQLLDDFQTMTILGGWHLQIGRRLRGRAGIRQMGIRTRQ